MSATAKIEGVHYVAGDGFTANGLTRKRRKPTLAELKGLEALLADAQAVSDGLRAAKVCEGPETREGDRPRLLPVPPSPVREHLAAEIALRESAAVAGASRKRKAAPAMAGAALSPVEDLKRASKAREKARRDVEKANDEIRAAVKRAQAEGLTMVDIAAAIGCSRPALYELVAK